MVKDRCLLWNDEEMNYRSEDANVLQNSAWVSFSACVCVYLRELKGWDAMILSLFIVEKLIYLRKKMEGEKPSSHFCCIL